MATKTCTACGATKSVSDFYAHPKSRDGLQSHCKTCMRESAATRYAATRRARAAAARKARYIDRDTETERCCRRCAQVKPLTAFPHTRGRGYHVWCKECMRDYTRQYQPARTARRRAAKEEIARP